MLPPELGGKLFQRDQSLDGGRTGEPFFGQDDDAEVLELFQPVHQAKNGRGAGPEADSVRAMAEVADSHPMAYESDAEDTQFLRDQDIASLLAKYEPVITGRCVAKLRGSLDAEDVAQNVILRLLGELQRGKTYRVPYRVVVHQVIGWTIKDHFEGRPTDLPLPDDWEPADVEDEAGGIVSRYYLEDLIAGLPDQTRSVMKLRYLRGLEHEQIAEELGITRNNVDQRLHQGHKALRETLAHG